MKKFKDFILECYDLFENRVVNQSEKNVRKWIKDNGFSEVRAGGKHPMLQHKETGKRITGCNRHGKNISPQALRNMATSMEDHHNEHGIKYFKLG